MPLKYTEISAIPEIVEKLRTQFETGRKDLYDLKDVDHLHSSLSC